MAKDENKNKNDKKEQIGFHKGALTTLAKERQEFIRLLGVIEQLMQLHLKALKDLGVDLEKEAKKTENPEKKTKKKPIDEFLS